MEIRLSAVILLLILSVSFSCRRKGKPLKPSYKKFLHQHFGFDVTESLCSFFIQKREITATDGLCKPVHNFIKASVYNLKAICGDAGTPLGRNLFKSNQPFPVITCNLKSGQIPPRCDYAKGVWSNRIIVLECDEGWPVRYEDGILIPESPAEKEL